MDIRWVVQTNLGKQDTESIELACKNLGIEFISATAIPFSDELPDVSNDKSTIFYGATRWIDNIYRNNVWNPGVFFNPESIFTKWNDKYGEFSINYGANITTLDEFQKELDTKKYKSDHLFFIRPISDQKEFAGQVISAEDMHNWVQSVQTDLSDFGATEIIVAEPVGIELEWRCFMVNGKVSSATQYRRWNKFKAIPGAPKEVIEFAEERAKDYSPAPVFVMDIGKSKSLYVIEIGCFHSAGFYDADVEKIVKDISEYVRTENGISISSVSEQQVE